MMHKIKISFVLLLTMVCSFNTLCADSIWAKRDKGKSNLYAEDKARHIGDILTITITEVSTLDAKATRTLSKETSRSSNFDGDVGLDHIIPSLPALNVGAGTTHTNTMDGTADFKDKKNFTDSISAIVVDVMPNGNLVISGKTERNLANDIQIIEVTGIVRPSDINVDNVIRSEQIANFSIISRNKGVASHFTSPNWLGKIFDAIWPF